MEAVLERKKMGRPKGRPKSSDRDDVSVKLARDLVEKATMIKTHNKLASVAEYLSELLREPIARDWLKMVRELEADAAKNKPHRPER
jgi:hypothetical protein